MSAPLRTGFSRFPVPSLADMPADIRDRLLAVQEKLGFIPNVFFVLARRPDEFRAFFAYHDALMERPGNLTKAEREMIVVAVSSANQCLYCVVAHGAILRIRAKDPRLADQIAVNYGKADITERQKAMLDFAMKVAFEAFAVVEDDFATLADHGFDQEDAWDIAAIASFFGLSNRMANVTALRPNEEFYGLGGNGHWAGIGDSFSVRQVPGLRSWRPPALQRPGLGIYHWIYLEGKTVMADVAKVFMSGRSQAVRLPKKYRFDCDEVEVTREGDAVILRPRPAAPWSQLLATLAEIDALAEDMFPADREQPEMQERPELDRLFE